MANSPPITPSESSPQRDLQFQKLMEMRVYARFILGSCRMEIGDILKLGQGSLIELDHNVHKPLELWVNNQSVAQVESVVVNEKCAAKIIKVNPPTQRLNDLNGE